MRRADKVVPISIRLQERYYLGLSAGGTYMGCVLTVLEAFAECADNAASGRVGKFIFGHIRQVLSQLQKLRLKLALFVFMRMVFLQKRRSHFVLAHCGLL